MLFGGLFEFP
jgi:hypothetical protein